jgi:hypothetical protein
MAASSSTGRQIAGWAFVVILLAIAALIFAVTWLVESPTSVFYALVAIGALALVMALAAYLMRAAVAKVVIAEATSWGFLGMGFTVLLVTIGLYPDSTVSTTTRIVYAIVVLIVLAIAVLGFYWGAGQRPAEAARLAERQEWRQQPTVSAFEYTTAHPPSVPPPSDPGASPLPPRSP